MRLNETEMVKLLPAWMQEDGSDKGLATGCAFRYRRHHDRRYDMRA